MRRDLFTDLIGNHEVAYLLTERPAYGRTTEQDPETRQLRDHFNTRVTTGKVGGFFNGQTLPARFSVGLTARDRAAGCRGSERTAAANEQSGDAWVRGQQPLLDAALYGACIFGNIAGRLLAENFTGYGRAALRLGQTGQRRQAEVLAQGVDVLGQCQRRTNDTFLRPVFAGLQEFHPRFEVGLTLFVISGPRVSAERVLDKVQHRRVRLADEAAVLLLVLGLQRLVGADDLRIVDLGQRRLVRICECAGQAGVALGQRLRLEHPRFILGAQRVRLDDLDRCPCLACYLSL